MARTSTPPTDKQIAAARKVLSQHKYTPGVSTTANLLPDVRNAVKEACQILQRADQAGAPPAADAS
jgi:hypothetical protein